MRCEASNTWHCIQLGSREHYAIPRMMHQAGKLGMLITDAWAPPGSAPAKLAAKLNGRYHPELRDANVRAPKVGRLLFELRATLLRHRGWKRIFRRNTWFQRYAVRQLGIPQPGDSARNVLFSYSYTAREPFRWAKARGWKTVLGQIDPGPLEEGVVERDSVAYSRSPATAPRPPADYWSQWREEVDLADVMVVNSEWSRKLLCEAGVAEEKIRVVPLAYETAEAKNPVPGDLPSTFSLGRTLRVLFLGQVNLRKGVGQLFDAIEQLSHDPVEFRFTGPLSVAVPNSIRDNEKVEFVPSVPRHQTGKQYEWADLFILPTLSDGFAITQLEAQAAGVPIIASRRCGDVVRHGENGLLLDEVSPDSIADAIRRCISEPGFVAQLTANSKVEDNFSFCSVGESLRGLFPSESESESECMGARRR